MKTGASLKNRQGGAVAVMVGISMVLLVGFLAMVIDLGHLYVAKTGLQNAADAAALAGAKELNGTAAGVTSAISNAVNVANKNNYDFSKPVATTAADLDIWVCSSPDNCTVLASTAANDTTNLTAAGKTFLKVHTRNRNLVAWFAPIWNIFNISTYGSAVAGRFMTNIAPIGLCVLDPDPDSDPNTNNVSDKWVEYNAGGDSYKAEYGYMRGVNYNFGVINGTLAGLGPGTELYLHPTASTEEGCKESEGSADFAAPFLCTGRSVITGRNGDTVWTNTGLATGPSLGALNTRFDQYGPPLDNSLDSSVCPPDVNIKEYTPAVANNWMSPTPKQASAFLLDDWMASAASSVRAPLPSSVVDANLNAGGCGGGSGGCDDNYGVLWSYTRPELSSGSSVPADWPALYPQGPTTPVVSSPAYAGTESTAYSYGLANQGNSTYFLGPTPTHNPTPDRRLLNVVLVDCTTPASGGICREMKILGVGRFFMQRTATQAGGITGEFAGLVSDAELSPTIRLYR